MSHRLFRRPLLSATLALLCLLSPGLIGGSGLTAAEPAATSELTGSPDGRLHLLDGTGELCGFAPFAADAAWKFAWPTEVAAPADQPIRFTLPLGATPIPGELQVESRDGAVEARWTFAPTQDTPFNSLAVGGDISIPTLAGGSWEVDGQKGTFPQAFGGVKVFTGESKTLTIGFPDGRALKLSFPQGAIVVLQDNRQWSGQTFTVRIGRAMSKLAAGERWSLAMTIATDGGLAYRRDLPQVLAADQDWVPLATELDIVPGSALDLSTAGLTDGPCGSKGRVITTADGHFAYADDARTPRRFYGVNLCFSAQYLAKDKVDQLLDRLVRLGYNTVRIHHYEYRLTTSDWQPGFNWDPARIDQLDYLMAGCAKRGLWLTTDLYVSRPVPGRQIGLSGDKPEPGRYKLLVPVHEPAFQDWATFTRKFLDRVNPYTGRRVAEEPALAWVSLINEGPVAAGWGEAKSMPQWGAAWNRWLAQRFPQRDTLDLALGDLAEAEQPATGTVALPADLKSGTRRARLAQVFLADTEAAMVERMRRLLRDELKCPALLTDINNGGPTPVPLQLAREGFDYVDEHFYVDHPVFLKNQWQLPSRCANADPVREGAPGGTASASVRVWGRPFTVSEFDYSGPGRFRGVGGILTGALAALQDWDAVWRFAYAHKDQDIFTPAPIDYFNLVNDPLNQAADRAAVLLYLRRDLATAPGRIAVVMPRAELRSPPAGLALNGIEPLAWITRIGCALVDDPAGAPRDAVAVPLREAGDRAAVAARAIAAGIKGPDANGVVRSQTGEIAIDRRQGVLCIDTPRTAGGQAPAGGTFTASGAGLRVDGLTTGASLFASSLDLTPLRRSPRILVTHLTDLQNTGARYAESSRQTLLAWGGLPHLVRDGAATVHLALAEPAKYTVWALSTSGRRLEQIPATVTGGELTFTANVRGKDGARMLYEITR